MSKTIDLEVELPRAKGAPHLARWVMRTWCADRIEADLLADAELGVSELASNAIFHGQGQITLRAWLDENRLLVEVIDEGPGFERPLRHQDLGKVAGWGLDIVEDISSRWGVHAAPTDVWFELERSGPRHGTPDRAPDGSLARGVRGSSGLFSHLKTMSPRPQRAARSPRRIQKGANGSSSAVGSVILRVGRGRPSRAPQLMGGTGAEPRWEPRRDPCLRWED